MTGRECQDRDLARDPSNQIVKVNALMKTLLKTIALVALLLSLTAASSSSFVGFNRFAPSALQREGNPKVTVWVNTNSGVYHCPGTRWYGSTKVGVFMTQKEAQLKEYRPAYGSVCG